MYIVSETAHCQHSGDLILSHANYLLDSVLRRFRDYGNHEYVVIVLESMAIVKISGLVVVDLARGAEGLDGHPKFGPFAFLCQAKL